MYYDKRNRENINKLAPRTREKALELYEFAVKENIEILIYDTLRTTEQQRENVANGASQTMKSYHLVGQALDFVMTKNATADWNAYESENAKKFIAKAKEIEFEWGGDWKNFVDKVHLQYVFEGYGTDTYNNVSSNDSNNIYRGESIVEYLKSINVDSSFNNRAKLAAQNGISNYRGTAEQNIKLLNILSNQTALQNTSVYRGESIVEYLKSINVDSSFNNRAKLAKKHNISNYRGTAEQNISLLKKIRGF